MTSDWPVCLSLAAIYERLEGAMVEILAVMVGWFLGWGQSWLAERTRTRQVRRTISLELAEVAHRVVGVVYSIDQRRGGLDRASLTWMLPHLQRYAGLNPKAGLLTVVEGLLAASDSQLREVTEGTRGKELPSIFPRQGAPYTEATVRAIAEHDPLFTAAVLDVLSHLEMLNHLRDAQDEYTKRTFIPGISERNLQATYDDIDRVEVEICLRARIVADKISCIVADPPEKSRRPKTFWRRLLRRPQK